MVSCAEIIEESRRCIAELGDDFFRDFRQGIHEGLTALDDKYRERQARLNDAYARNWNRQVTI
mgnify:CR=1 FL=1